MARILNETGAGVVFNWDDKASIAAYINLCWRNFNDPTHEDISPEGTSDRIAEYSRRNTTKRMAALLESVSGKNLK